MKITALILIAAILLSACGSDNRSTFRVIGSLTSEEFLMAFRNGDRLRVLVEAALSELAAAGELTRLSQKWFDEDITILKGSAQAFDDLKVTPGRTLIVGVREGTPPMSYRDDNGNFTGFDVELAGLICRRLDWDIKILPITQEKAKVELQAGNIDCALGSGFDTTDKAISFSSPYMRNEKVIVTRSDSGLRSKNSLKDRELGMTYAPSSLSALQTDEKLLNSLRSYIRYQSVEQCFEALTNGDCDAILVDSVTANYYANRRNTG